MGEDVRDLNDFEIKALETGLNVKIIDYRTHPTMVGYNKFVCLFSYKGTHLYCSKKIESIKEEEMISEIRTTIKEEVSFFAKVRSEKYIDQNAKNIWESIVIKSILKYNVKEMTQTMYKITNPIFKKSFIRYVKEEFKKEKMITYEMMYDKCLKRFEKYEIKKEALIKRVFNGVKSTIKKGLNR